MAPCTLGKPMSLCLYGCMLLQHPLNIKINPIHLPARSQSASLPSSRRGVVLCGQVLSVSAWGGGCVAPAGARTRGGHAGQDVGRGAAGLPAAARAGSPTRGAQRLAPAALPHPARHPQPAGGLGLIRASGTSGQAGGRRLCTHHGPIEYEY